MSNSTGQLVDRLFNRRQQRREDVDEYREVQVNQSASNQDFCNNRVTNTKYSIITFLPLNLFEQFSRFMNCYFLLIASLQLFPAITPVSPVTTWAPLIVIFTISAIKEALDDVARYRMDLENNSRQFSVIRDGQMVNQMKSEDIMVGDIVRLNNEQEIPCDVVLLYAEPLTDDHGEALTDNGVCFVQTANIDGETDLKVKRVPLQLQSLDTEQCKVFSGTIQCSIPNKQIYQFDSVLRIQSNTGSGSDVISLTPDQLLLQGSHLKNTKFIYGVAVYTGNETKLSMNKGKPKVKLTNLDRYVDLSSRYIFILQLCIVVIMGFIGNSLSSSEFEDYDYLELQLNRRRWFTGLVIPLRMLLLMSFMIPISLKVSLDISKYVASCFIAWDLKMYDEDREQAAVASNTNLADDLGQIQYVFSDKTGTLTMNKMELKSVVFDSVCVNLVDLREGRMSSIQNTDSGSRFWTGLALCHTVSAVEDEDGGVVFKGQSPDEEALVLGASLAGYKFQGRHKDLIDMEASGSKLKFKVLNVLEFSSDRKRMSVIVRQSSDDQILLIMKGADEMMLPRCVGIPQDVKNNLEYFASQGLRTLCVGQKFISPSDYQKWASKLQSAQNSMDNRDQKVGKVYDQIEKDLQFLGICAIEDELQHNVPETITMLRDAGMKVWMLTGDKMETALQIGKSCNLISHSGDGKVFIVSSTISQTDVSSQLKQCLDQVSADRRKPGGRYRAASNRVISPVIENIIHHNNENDDEIYSVVVDGSTLNEILIDDEMRQMFINLCNKAATVVCCRVTPSQKSAVVGLVKEKGFKTLSIGDGGNDVAMIQNAHVGVGIMGKEGLQASRAADYSFTSFQFLVRLIIIHGRYSYNRIAYLALYCFYKSIFIGALQALYELYCGFSGTSLLSTFALSSYNVLFTAFPILFYCLDKDLPENVVLENPSIYQAAIAGDRFSGKVMGVWAFRAFCHSFLTLAITLAVFSLGINESGTSSSSYIAIGMTAYSAGILIQTATMAIETNTFTVYNHIAIWGSMVMYFILAYLISLVTSFELHGLMAELYSNGSFWFCIILVVVLSTLPVICMKLIRKMFYPVMLDRLQMELADKSLDIELTSSNEHLPLTRQSRHELNVRTLESDSE
ncbi:hypothetical protein MIR68_001160 [Amoeboaphelidium protococcarum]|nr:hypothetical protein MIR68_001160 [Amoeboaphelidium protococcarum]